MPERPGPTVSGRAGTVAVSGQRRSRRGTHTEHEARRIDEPRAKVGWRGSRIGAGGGPIVAGNVGAQVVGSTTIGVSVEELKVVAVGWNVKKKILGKPVYNDKNEKIGVVKLDPA